MPRQFIVNLKTHAFSYYREILNLTRGKSSVATFHFSNFLISPFMSAVTTQCKRKAHGEPELTSAALEKEGASLL